MVLRFVPFFNVRCVYVWETMGAFTGVNGVNIKSVGVFFLLIFFFLFLFFTWYESKQGQRSMLSKKAIDYLSIPVGIRAAKKGEKYMYM